ncbi:scarecrow-like protein 18 isoform X2 [Jatropha curcas]|uniref:scarecrow-like protein 18 isoform X2 n=1 Tax=Jatropha curcas TaxID=180498 RepID=UPI0009D67927|nr:scarecrow-like protein 18 isoform X2 [Jatropha curcas]
MLGSLNSSSSHDQEEEPEPLDLHLPHPPPPPPLPPSLPLLPPPSSTHMHQLLISCAELISQSDFSAAHRLLSVLSSASSSYGDSRERLLHQFVKALSFRLSHRGGVDAGSSSSSSTASRESEEALQSCYLSLNQITPFIRFSHLTANQAILEAIEVGQQAIHIIDFDIMHGVQWPPLMQALAERSTNTLYPPPMLRITGTGHDLNILHRTGDRLFKFAQSLGLKFQFHPLLLNNDHSALPLHLPSAITILPNEALAVNCVFYLHRLLKEDSRNLRIFLHKIKALNPKVVTVAEREANHNHPFFFQRFLEALDHYTAIFDSLEATVAPNSRERLAVEQIWFGKEIMEIVAGEGEERRERHERFEAWEMILRSSGFSNVPLSPFALSQAKLLLRLHYPCEAVRIY